MYQSTLTFFGVFFQRFFWKLHMKKLKVYLAYKFFAHIDCASCSSLESEEKKRWETTKGRNF
jgi:hypothetical protein